MDLLPQDMIALGTARSAIRELFEFGKARAAIIGAENVFDFSIGNPSVPAPDCVAQTAASLLRGDPVALHGYTSAQGDAGARALIAADLSARSGERYSADDLYMSMGAAAALCCCFKALTCPGDEFIVLAPYFPEYSVFLAGAGAGMRIVPPETDSFQIDFAALEALIGPNTKGVIVNSPNNPSGVVYSEETCRRLGELLTAKSKELGHTIWLVSDEPYREIVYDGCVTPWLPHYYKDTLVCYSFSKSLSLPGERVGYILVPPSCTDARTVYAAVAGAGRSLGYVCAPSMFQRVASLCVGQTADLSVYKTNRRLLLDSLREMGFTCVEPNGTFYLFPRTLIADDVSFCEKAKDFDLLLVPGSGFGCPGHMRISYCVPTERIQRSLPAFQKLADHFRQA